MLSDKAIEELREIFSEYIPQEIIEGFSDEDVSSIGLFYLEVFCQAIKLKVGSQNFNQPAVSSSGLSTLSEK